METNKDSDHIQIVHTYVNREGLVVAGKLLKAMKMVTFSDPYADAPFYTEMQCKLTLALYADDLCLGCLPVDRMDASKVYKMYYKAGVSFTMARGRSMVDAATELCQKAAAKALEDLEQAKLEEAERKRAHARLNRNGQPPI